MATPVMRTATVRPRSGKLGQSIEIGPHTIVADEVAEVGGDDAGPAPHDFLLAALGACTAMTLKIYAERKGWPLVAAEVRLSQAREGEVHVMRRDIRLEGALSDEQRQKLLEIASKCPVHKTLTGQIRIDSVLAPG
jgi:putative redox protein